MPGAWPRWTVLLPHVLVAAGHAEQAGEQLDQEGMQDLSWLLNQAGLYLQVQARFTDARALHERALAIDEVTDGPDHPTVATDLNNLAQILRALGQVEAARPLQERALAIDEAAYGPDHPDVARNLNNLALILHDLGQVKEAQALQERALAIGQARREMPGHGLIGRNG